MPVHPRPSWWAAREGEHTTREFQRASRALESALEHFAATITMLGTAKTQEERRQVASKIKHALDHTDNAFEALTPFSTFRMTPRARRAKLLTPPIDRTVARKLLEFRKLPKAEQLKAINAWIKSAGTPKLIAKRRQKVNLVIAYARMEAKETAPRQPRSEICAFVFCDCYEKGRLRRPPPHPEIVTVLPNSDPDVDQDLTCLGGQMRYAVTTALKFRKPIAM